MPRGGLPQLQQGSLDSLYKRLKNGEQGQQKVQLAVPYVLSRFPAAVSSPANHIGHLRVPCALRAAPVKLPLGELEAVGLL